MNKPKLELEVNKPTRIQLLTDNPKTGKSSYGEWFLYNLRNGDGTTEYTYFAPPEVHEVLKNMKAFDEVIITKLASQRGKKVVTTYDIKKVDRIEDTESTKSAPNNSYLSAMEQSFEEAIAIQNKFNGMANVNQIAITLFIQRTKGNHSFN